MVNKHTAAMIKMTKQHFPDTGRIFWTPGNNDGPHSSLFVHRNRDSIPEAEGRAAQSTAWADALLAAGVVDDSLPRTYTFELENDEGCADDVGGSLAAAHTDCAAAVQRVGAIQLTDNAVDTDGCGCGQNWGWNADTAACAEAQTTTASEATACSARDACGCYPGWGWSTGAAGCAHGVETNNATAVACQQPRDACGCVVGYGWSGSSASCGLGKNTNPAETVDCACARPIDNPASRSLPSAVTAGWLQPRRCLAPGGDGDGCVRLIDPCPLYCQSCFVPPTGEVHEFDLSPTEFFSRVGYYMKAFDPDDSLGLRAAKIYVIVLNTNLGAANQQQGAAFEADLQWVSERGGMVYILGHHPGIMSNPGLVPEPFRSMVLGKFAGHVHWAESTDDDGYTQLGSISQAGETSFSVQTVGGGQGLEIDIKLGRDVVSWTGGTGALSEEHLWQVNASALASVLAAATPPLPVLQARENEDSFSVVEIVLVVGGLAVAGLLMKNSQGAKIGASMDLNGELKGGQAEENPTSSWARK